MDMPQPQRACGCFDWLIRVARRTYSVGVQQVGRTTEM